ncbi:MAG: lipoyl(octanoyl) transferase [Fimbriimonadaceae bacterium]|jgi:lipoate-protein ligase A|nr:lipoyl(octanoyl) transferase [Fimbriimonadaceae bacterium]
MNMRLDEDLLKSAELGVAGCRVYSWTEPWITLGKFQSPEKDLMPGSDVPWVLRPTGGKAVLHGHDITVGFAMPLAGSSRSLRAVYRAMADPLICALRECGLPAALGENTRFSGRGPRVADCFAYLSANDIVDERTGQKVCGCALKVTRTAALVQASIPAGRPLVDPATVIVGGKALVGPPWDSERFAQALQKALA